MVMEITSLGAADVDEGRVMRGLRSADVDEGRVMRGLRSTGVDERAVLTAADVDEGRVMRGLGDLVALLDGIELGQGSVRNADYGGNYHGGSNFSRWLPVERAGGLVGFGNITQQGAMSPEGAAQFPGAGGTYTGGSDYSPYLPLNPSGLAALEFAGLTDFPSLGSVERGLAAGPAESTEHIERTVALAARDRTRRGPVVARLTVSARELDAIASRRLEVANRAAAEYKRLRDEVEALDKRIATMRQSVNPRAAAAAGTLGAQTRELQRLDRERREKGRLAIRWAKLHGLSTVLLRNARTQAQVARDITGAVEAGKGAAAATLGRFWAQIGSTTRRLLAVRSQQRKNFAGQTRQDRLNRLLARKARLERATTLIDITAQRRELTPAEKVALNKAQARARAVDQAIAALRAPVRHATRMNGLGNITQQGAMSPEGAAQFPGAGGTYTGGSDYSPYLPLNPSGLAAYDPYMSDGQRPDYAQVGTWLANITQQGAMSPEGAAQFPGAGGTYTGGSDYSPYLPLNPSGLAAYDPYMSDGQRPDYFQTGTWLANLEASLGELEGVALGNIFDDIGKGVRSAARSVSRAANSVANSACGLLNSGAGQQAANAAGVVPVYGTAVSAGAALARSACGSRGKPQRRRPAAIPAPAPRPAAPPVRQAGAPRLTLPSRMRATMPRTTPAPVAPAVVAAAGKGKYLIPAAAGAAALLLLLL